MPSIMMYPLIIYILMNITLFLAAHPLGSVEPSIDYKVVFVTTLFRHGDRAPTSFCPNDPNTVDDLQFTGLGQLTLAGKSRAYQLGTELRYLYKDLLGETYIPYIVKARSTDVDRTKMTLLLVLRTYNYVPGNVDILMSPDRTSLKYLEELKSVRQLEVIKTEVENYRPLMKNLTLWTGREINSTTYISRLFHTLTAEWSMGLKFPAWADNEFVHQQMLDATILEYMITNYNSNLRRLFGGMLLRNIIETMEGIANGTITDKRKIQLFSGHESTLVALLSSIGIYTPHVPEYTSCVIVELLQDDAGEYYVGIRYYLGIPPQTITLQIPRCEANPCPLWKFTELMKEVIPTDEDMVTVSGGGHK